MAFWVIDRRLLPGIGPLKRAGTEFSVSETSARRLESVPPWLGHAGARAGNDRFHRR